MQRARDSQGESARVFASQEERDRWQIAQYGHVKNGYREPEDYNDGRGALLPPPFWNDGSEQLSYEYAVESNPIREGEGWLTYLGRVIASLPPGLKVPRQRAEKAMPRALADGRAPMTARATDARLQALNKQALQILPGEPIPL